MTILMQVWPPPPVAVDTGHTVVRGLRRQTCAYLSCKQTTKPETGTHTPITCYFKMDFWLEVHVWPFSSPFFDNQVAADGSLFNGERKSEAGKRDKLWFINTKIMKPSWEQTSIKCSRRDYVQHNYYRIWLSTPNDCRLLFHLMCQHSNTQCEYFHAFWTQRSGKLKYCFLFKERASLSIFLHWTN